MTKYVATRLLTSVFTIVAIAIVMFALLQLLPGSPFNSEKLDAVQKALLTQKYGLDEPVLLRLGTYLVNLARGDFGISYNLIPDFPVSEMLGSRLPVTIRIGLQALVLGVVLGLLIGIVSAIRPRGWFDNLSTFVSVIAFSVPSFVIALLLVYFVGFEWKLLPIRYSESNPFTSSVLPTISLAAYVMAVTARYARSEMLDCLESDYILLAKAKGIGPSKVIGRHALRNTLVSIITVLSPLLIGLITGSVVIEQIFGAPGLGQLLLTAIQNVDYNIVIAISLVYSIIYILVMLLVDVLYGLIDPRIRLAGQAA
ncbi:ABC transporter permease [Rathayibacter sp. AY1B8]|uniref:ABC transporter permease n=1 Tax=Rathayibacter sp. AY1B8 TaxID=2080533 RepID=UPI000CE7917B|nr:ABC transporter permease [Rathayibacter sp. AY1B8]PPI08288.1 peptide ABC transporter permease [Rathayibacter sp. AY1B8]